MRFDYYSATVPAQVSHCIHMISEKFGGGFSDLHPKNGYKKGALHEFSGIEVHSGGYNPDPYLLIKGDRSPDAAAFIREAYPSHKVSRADVCIDFVEVGGFDRMKAILNQIAADIRPKAIVPELRGPETDHPTVGRTMYYGSIKSDVRICLYEKGKQMRAQGLVVPLEWFRVELRVKPRKERKRLSAGLSEAEFWGFSKWTKTACTSILNISPEYRPDASLRKSTAEKAVHHMLRQYGRAMTRYADEIGEDAFIRKIREVLADG